MGSGPVFLPGAGSLVEAILEGGPNDIPAADRSRAVPVAACSVKLERLGGYEHFERDGEPGAAPEGPVVFRWAARTRMAE